MILWWEPIYNQLKKPKCYIKKTNIIRNTLPKQIKLLDWRWYQLDTGFRGKDPVKNELTAQGRL